MFFFCDCSVCLKDWKVTFILDTFLKDILITSSREMILFSWIIETKKNVGEFGVGVNLGLLKFSLLEDNFAILAELEHMQPTAAANLPPPGGDMDLQTMQSMDWLFKKERIYLLAQFWQQVGENFSPKIGSFCCKNHA